MNSTIAEGHAVAVQRRLQISRDVRSGKLEYVQCPLCGEEAALGGRVGSTMNSLIACLVCGDFQVCYEAEVNLIRNYKLAPLGHLLSGISRASCDRHESPQLLLWVYDTSGNTDVDFYHFGGGEPIGIKASQKVELLLSAIQRRCDFQVGVSVNIIVPDDRAMGFAKSNDEFLGLLSELEKAESLTIINQSTENELTVLSVSLTAAGADQPKSSLQLGKGIIVPENIEIDGKQFEFFNWKDLGEGGFGEVFRGESKEFGPVAIKRIRYRKSEQGRREIEVVNSLVGRNLSNVLPVYAAGLDRDSSHLHIVMALGERSLKQALEDDGPFDESKTLEMVEQIANGLVAIQNTNDSFHHRDLKPANVLEYDGSWHIADFGNCRFEDADTSVNTMADFKSPPYAAPEQWERGPTSIKTDVYALGCIMHELLTRRPPFEGNGIREKHLTEQPPSCEGVSGKTNQKLASMLSKNPTRRPNPADLFGEIDSGKSNAFSQLRQKAARMHQEQDQIEVEEKSAGDAAARLAAQAKDASKWLHDKVISHFLNQLESAFEGLGESKDLSFELPGKVRLTFSPPVPQRSSYQSCGWDVLAESSIEVVRLDNQYSWGHSLVFGKPTQVSIGHSWHEVGFGTSPLFHCSSYNRDMFHAYQKASVATTAIGGGAMGNWIVGFGPFDLESNLDEFIERWASLFNKAIEGDLKTPRTFPPQGKWWQ